MAQVLVSNDKEPVGVVMVTLPIPDGDYSKTINDLREMGIGDVRMRDCYVDQITDAPPVLDCLEGQTVNIDELDFLFRSIDRYTDDELAEFQAVAAKREITDIENLINLSFCSERATVITNFDNLEIVGRRHYMTMQGGGCSTEEYAKLNGVGIARGLIASGEGTVTPYGVVYENGMQLEALYTGRSFPAYTNQVYMMELELAPVADGPEESPTFLVLPTPEERLERLVERAGYGSTSEVTIHSWNSELPEALNQAMYIPQEDLRMLNSLCEKVAEMSDEQRKALTAAVRYAQPQGVYQVNRVAEELEQFEFVPGISTPEEYGKFLIQKSEQYDPALEDFYDYEKYGQSRVESEEGQFLAGGYVRFMGSISMEELLMEPPSPGPEQGGMQMVGF